MGCVVVINVVLPLSFYVKVVCLEWVTLWFVGQALQSDFAEEALSSDLLLSSDLHSVANHVEAMSRTSTPNYEVLF